MLSILNDSVIPIFLLGQQQTKIQKNYGISACHRKPQRDHQKTGRTCVLRLSAPWPPEMRPTCDARSVGLGRKVRPKAPFRTKNKRINHQKLLGLRPHDETMVTLGFSDDSGINTSLFITGTVVAPSVTFTRPPTILSHLPNRQTTHHSFLPWISSDTIGTTSD